MNTRPKVARPKVPWSRGDRFLMFVLGLVLPLALGLFLWLRALDKDPDISIPTPTMPATNAREYYIAAANAVVDGDKIGFAVGPWNPATKPSGDNHFYSPADKEKLVVENAGAIKTLHTGFQYLYQEPPSRSYSTPFPHYQKIREMARLLALQAQTDAGQGDWNGAVNADLDAIQVGEQLPRGGPLIGMLVGVACQAIGRKQAWTAPSHLTAAQSQAAAQRLTQIRAYHVPYLNTLQEEKWTGQAGLLEIVRHPDWSVELAKITIQYPSGGESTDDSPGRWVLATRIRLMGKRRILADYTQTLDRMIAEARQPFAAHFSIPTAASAGDPITDMLMPSFGNMRINEVSADTQNALLSVTLALRAYKLDHGAYPPTLAALAPQYLQAIPPDPFALSGPVLYKRTGTNYLLYSVGPDGKDDGGRAIFDRTKPAPTTIGGSDQRRYVQPDSQGDIVAGVNTN